MLPSLINSNSTSSGDTAAAQIDNPFYDAQPASSSVASTSSNAMVPSSMTADSLRFQDIPHQQQPQPPQASSPQPPKPNSPLVSVNIDPLSSNPFTVSLGSQNNQAQQQQQQQSKHFYQLEYYKEFFDVNTKQILSRVGRTFVPWSSPLFNEESRPDLYGPFWICCTLVFMMSVTANMASYFASSSAVAWQSDYSMLTFAAGVFFSWISIIPLIFWILQNYFADGRPISEIISLFGYSLMPFVPAAIVCAVPQNLVRWIVLTLCLLLSLRFLIYNLYKNSITPVMIDSQRHRIYTILIIVACAQAGLFTLTKFYFFTY